MLRFGLSFALAMVVLGIPLPEGGRASQVPVRLPPRIDSMAGVVPAQPPRGTTHARVAQWTRPILHQRKGEAAPQPEPTRQIILTFDDGPDMHTTPPVLAELKRRNLKAIFFVAGRRLVAGGRRGQIQRELARQMVRDGHMVANHTVNHVHLCGRRRNIVEIDENERIIRQTIGIRPVLFRAPFGDKCPLLDAALAERGLVDVGWSIDPQDWRLPPAEKVVAYVKRKLELLPGKAVLLLHDTRRPGVAALPAILDFIEAENARARTGLTRPIEIRDYTSLLPARPAPTTGLEAVAANLLDDVMVLPRWLATATRTPGTGGGHVSLAVLTP